MRYWSIQSDEVINTINNVGVYYPDFKKNRYVLEREDLHKLYQWLLNCFNDINNTNFSGLVFAFAELTDSALRAFSDYEDFKSFIIRKKDIVEIMWKNYNNKYKIVEIEFNEPLNILLCGFNDFQIIMPPETPCDEACDIKKALTNGRFMRTKYTKGLMQAHIPYIKKENIKGIYDLFY